MFILPCLRYDILKCFIDLHLSKLQPHDHTFMLDAAMKDHKIWSHHILDKDDLLHNFPLYSLTHLREAVKSFQIHTCGNPETSKCWVTNKDGESVCRYSPIS